MNESGDEFFMIIILLGVSGSGKSTVGKMLAESLSCDFFDADDFHNPENKAKMNKGIPLADEDRIPWLDTLNQLIQNLCEQNKDAVLACSALKNSYRYHISGNIGKCIRWIYLKGDFETINARLSNRKGHFFDPDLLRSQFETLEEPTNAFTVDIRYSPKEIVDFILSKIFG